MDDEAKKLADEHWDYVEQVIRQTEVEVNELALQIIAFHYKTAFMHGYKHGKNKKK